MLNFPLLHPAFRYKDETRSANWKAVLSTTGVTGNTNLFFSSRPNSVHVCEIHKLSRPIETSYTLQNYLIATGGEIIIKKRQTKKGTKVRLFLNIRISYKMYLEVSPTSADK